MKLMIFRYLHRIFERIIYFFDFIYNYLLFHVFNCSWLTFPRIGGKVVIRGAGSIVFGKLVKINSKLTSNPVGLTTKCCFYCMSGAEIKIGNNVGISNSLLYAKVKIIIEDDVLIGGGCQILDNDFHSLNFNERIKPIDIDIKSSPVFIKKGAFIGTSCVILKGVTIGKESIIAAGSVVHKSVPDLEIWGGNPARYIGKVGI